jgi:hypothetical protein
MRKERRQEKIKRRKNFFPTLIIIFFLWAFLFLLIYFVDPATFGALPVFFALIFFASLFTFSALLANSLIGLIYASGLTLFVILRYFGIGNILNFLLIFGAAASLNFYLTKS